MQLSSIVYRDENITLAPSRPASCRLRRAPPHKVTAPARTKAVASRSGRVRRDLDRRGARELPACAEPRRRALPLRRHLSRDGLRLQAVSSNTSTGRGGRALRSPANPVAEAKSAASVPRGARARRSRVLRYLRKPTSARRHLSGRLPVHPCTHNRGSSPSVDV